MAKLRLARRRLRPPLRERPCALYRHFDGEGRLLYVGIAVNPLVRSLQHRHGAPWWREVVEIRLTHYASRDAAMAAERQAIRTEKPRHNRMHNKKVTSAT